MLQQVTEV